MDKDKAAKNIKQIIEKMQTETDLTLLGEYRKIFKKEVSLFRQSWAAAWLLMYYDQKENPNLHIVKKSEYKSERQSTREERPSTPPAAAEPEVVLAEEESKRLFISIGKNRRLYPREVVALLSSKTSAEREDIGNIRILDNYSFVQVRDTKADEIIQALNGFRFRGRTLTVNYAKPKNPEAEQLNTAQQE
jgi:hypothetical protein